MKAGTMDGKNPYFVEKLLTYSLYDIDLQFLSVLTLYESLKAIKKRVFRSNLILTQLPVH